MKNSSEFYASIDIGTQNIVILIGRMLTNGKLQIIAKSAVEVSKDAVIRGEIKKLDIKKSINEALEDIKKSYGFDIKTAFVALSGEHIVCENHSGYKHLSNSDGAVEQEDLDELNSDMKSLKFDSGKRVISILPQSYVLDGTELTSPLSMIGNKLEGVFNIVMGDEKIISLFTRVLNECDIEISKITLSSIASSRAVLMEGETELGVMVVDIGAGTTDVAIYAEDSLKYLGVIPIGGSIINKDIRSIGILEKYIERLKVYHGNALCSTVDDETSIALPAVGKLSGKEISQQVLSNIIEARCVDIITYLIGILESTGLKNRLGSGIVITGGGANMKNIDLLFEKYFDCQVRVASPVESVDEISYEHIEDPMYSTAIGLLLDGIESGYPSEVIKVDLESEESNAEANVEDGEVDLFSVKEGEQKTEQDEKEVKSPKSPLFKGLGEKIKKFITEIE